MQKSARAGKGMLMRCVNFCLRCTPALMCSCNYCALYQCVLFLLLYFNTCCVLALSCMYACAPATLYFSIYYILALSVLLLLMCPCSKVLLHLMHSYSYSTLAALWYTYSLAPMCFFIYCILALSLPLLHICFCSNILL
jgi:hypothetical protein